MLLASFSAIESIYRNRRSIGPEEGIKPRKLANIYLEGSEWRKVFCSSVYRHYQNRKKKSLIDDDGDYPSLSLLIKRHPSGALNEKKRKEKTMRTKEKGKARNKKVLKLPRNV